MLLGYPHVWQPPFVELSVIQQVVTVIPHDSPCMLIPESPGNGCVWKWCVPQITICLGKLWSINGVRCCSHVFFRKKNAYISHKYPIFFLNWASFNGRLKRLLHHISSKWPRKLYRRHRHDSGPRNGNLKHPKWCTWILSRLCQTNEGLCQFMPIVKEV